MVCEELSQNLTLSQKQHLTPDFVSWSKDKNNRYLGYLIIIILKSALSRCASTDYRGMLYAPVRSAL